MIGPIEDDSPVKYQDKEHKSALTSQVHQVLLDRMYWRQNSTCPIGLVFNSSSCTDELYRRGLVQFSTQNLAESSEPLCLVAIPPRIQRLSNLLELSNSRSTPRIHLTLPFDEPVSPSFSFLIEQELLEVRRGTFPLLELALKKKEYGAPDKQRKLDMRPLLPVVVTYSD